MHPQALALYREFEAMLGRRPAYPNDSDDEAVCAGREAHAAAFDGDLKGVPADDQSCRIATRPSTSWPSGRRRASSVQSPPTTSMSSPMRPATPTRSTCRARTWTRTEPRHRGALAVGRLAGLLGARHAPARRRHALPRADLSVPGSRQARRPARRFRALHEKRERPVAAVRDPGREDPTARCCSKASQKSRRPTATIVLKDHQLPMLLVDEHDHFGVLVARCQRLPPMPTAVVCPDDANSLGGALLSLREGLIAPFLVGSRDRILKAAEAAGRDVSDFIIIDIEDHSEAATRAVAMVNAKEVRAVMKGNVHSDELLAQVVKKDGGLRTRAASATSSSWTRRRRATSSSSPTPRSTSRPTLPPRSTSCRTRSSSPSPAVSICRKWACSRPSRP